MADGPNKVVQSSRQVIEHKLLAALDDAEKVAIICSKEDLDLQIYALRKAMTKDDPKWNELRECCAGLEQLRQEAFGE